MRLFISLFLLLLIPLPSSAQDAPQSLPAWAAPQDQGAYAPTETSPPDMPDVPQAPIDGGLGLLLALGGAAYGAYRLRRHRP